MSRSSLSLLLLSSSAATVEDVGTRLTPRAKWRRH
jgi:hypothetical protein